MDEEIDDDEDDGLLEWLGLFCVVVVTVSLVGILESLVGDWVGGNWVLVPIGILVVLWVGMAIYTGGIYGRSEGYTRKTTPVRYYVTLAILLYAGIEFILIPNGTSIYEITNTWGY